MKSKLVLSLTAVIAFLVLTAGTLNRQTAEEPDYTTSFKKYNVKWGARCLLCSNYAPNSFTVSYRNVSKEKLDAKFAVQEQNKKWKTFLRSGIAPNDTVAVYACDGTGKSMFWAKAAGDKTTAFPTDDEINKEYGPKN